MLSPGAVALIYHRVASPAVDPFGLAVSPGHFAEQMEVIRSLARPSSLAEALRHLDSGGSLRKRVVVTFDDGYADNLSAALPILERTDVPATLFVASGYIDGGSYWWDDLGDLFLSPGRIPRRLSLDTGQGPAWDEDASEAAEFEEGEARRHAGWRFTAEMPPTPRHRLYQSLYFRLQGLKGDGPRKAVAALRAWAGRPGPSGSDGRAMTSGELDAIGSCPLIEIGAHTRYHPRLPDLTAREQAEEIRSGKSWLEGRLDRPVTSFSYPYGRFDGVTVEALREAGLACGLAAGGGGFRRGAAPYALPRGWVEDWDGDTFGRRLHAWLSD